MAKHHAQRFAVPSSLEHLASMSDDLRVAVDAVLDHSSLLYNDINAGSSAVFFVGWYPWRWAPLDSAGQAALKPAREAAERWRTFARSAILAAAPEREPAFAEHDSVIDRIIEQPDDWGGALGDSIAAIRAKANEGLNKQRAVLESLPTAHGAGERLLVVDTSALLDRPDLQNWRLDGGPWTIIALPQVLSELDERKRDPRTRDAADKVIRQINDFDRRGDTLSGVPVAGRVSYREVVGHPDMDRTLPWLRRDVPDDVIIAGALELAWQDLTARIAVMASDRNLQNKARVAGLNRLSLDAL